MYAILVFMKDHSKMGTLKDRVLLIIPIIEIIRANGELV
jgi:hypothetical protein